MMLSLNNKSKINLNDFTEVFSHNNSNNNRQKVLTVPLCSSKLNK